MKAYQQIVTDCIREYEDQLSDGFQFYARGGKSGVRDVLNELASSILEELRQAGFNNDSA